MSERLLRLPVVLDHVGCGRSTIYGLIAKGLFPAPVSLGARMSAWPESEVSAVVAARIRGASDDDLRALITDLETQRKVAA